MHGRLLPVAMLLVAALPAAGLAQRNAARIDTTVAFPASGHIDVSVPTGDIRVTGWDRDEVRVRAASERGDVQVGVRGSRLVIRADAVRRRLGDTSIEVTVPRGASLTLATHSGELVARGIRGDLSANVTNGGIEISDIGGTTSLRSVTGDIRGERLGGVTKAVGVNGNVVLRDVEGEITASTTNGRVLLSNVRSRSVKAGSINGTVEYAGTFERAGTYDFQAHNGNITLFMPEGTNASLVLGTYSGHVESDLPLTLTGGQMRSRQRYTFTLGTGGATISAQSHTGNIFIRRAPRANP